MGANLFEIAAPEIGEIVNGQKELKTIAKLLEKKQFENSWEAEITKFKLRTSRTISRTRRLKNSSSCTDIFDF